MRHVGTLALAAALGLGLLAGCGGNEPTTPAAKPPPTTKEKAKPSDPPKRVVNTADYCRELKSTLKNAKFVTPDDEYLVIFRATAAKAPDHLAPHWKQAVELMEKLKKAEADKNVREATAVRDRVLQVMAPIGKDLSTACEPFLRPTEPPEPTTGAQVSKEYCALARPLFKGAAIKWTRPNARFLADLGTLASKAPADMKPHWDRLLEYTEKRKLESAMVKDPNADQDKLSKIQARTSELGETLRQDLEEVYPNVDRCP